jgi:hypothetical protein
LEQIAGGRLVEQGDREVELDLSNVQCVHGIQNWGLFFLEYVHVKVTEILTNMFQKSH